MKASKILVPFAALLLGAQLAVFAHAEDTPAPAVTPEAAAAEASPAPAEDTPVLPDGGIPAPDVEAPDLNASAANAAVMLREGVTGARYQHWATALGHAHNFYPLKKVTANMLRCAAGELTDVPVGREPVALRVCHEVPLPVDGQELERESGYNLHGAIYAATPLVSVTATLSPRGEEGTEQSVTVTFDPAANITAWSIDEPWQTVEQVSLEDGLNFRLCRAGGWKLSIRAATVGLPAGKELYSASFQIVSVKAHSINQNLFDDNWDEAFAFFGGDREQFTFNYWMQNAASPEFISTEQAWVKKYIVKSELHGANVHTMALENFNLANLYLQTSYIKINTPKYDNAKVLKLDKLILGGGIGTRVPRFVKSGGSAYVSHHSFGTCADVNDKLYPNTNVETNHALIGDDVRDCLRYDGISVDEKGQSYYEFTYTGSYKGYTQRIPNTIINYLLYELAFYRAGFGWGYYYETACDGMHFTLTELDVNRHMDSDVGLRKVYEYYN